MKVGNHSKIQIKSRERTSLSAMLGILGSFFVSFPSRAFIGNWYFS